MPCLSSDLANTDIPPEIVFVFLFLGLLKSTAPKFGRISDS
jgi:hypothetical protein